MMYRSELMKVCEWFQFKKKKLKNDAAQTKVYDGNSTDDDSPNKI